MREMYYCRLAQQAYAIDQSMQAGRVPRRDDVLRLLHFWDAYHGLDDLKDVYDTSRRCEICEKPLLANRQKNARYCKSAACLKAAQRKRKETKTNGII